MSNIDKQAVQAVADLKAGYTLGHADVAILNELARIALASLEAEPVMYVMAGEDFDSDATSVSKAVVDSWVEEWNQVGDRSFRTVPLYAAPPAPVSVPEPIKRNDADGWWMYKGRRVGGGCAEWYNRALDDCRAAMLQGAEPVTTAYKLPEGWVAVPVEPTKEMIDAGWSYYMTTKSPSSLGVYGAMLAATPQQDV